MFLNEIERQLYTGLYDYVNQDMLLSWNEDLVIKARFLILSESDNGKDFGEKGYIGYYDFVFENVSIVRKPKTTNLGNYLKYGYYDEDEHFSGVINEEDLINIIKNNQALAITYYNHPTTIKLEDGNIIFNSESQK